MSSLYPAPVTADWRQKLSEDKYIVRARHIDILPEYEVRDMGVFTTGDPDLDRGRQNEWVTLFKSISELTELFRQGAPFLLTSARDTVQIYCDIHAYLVAWIRYLENNLANRQVPIDDLILLDGMAEHIYAHANCDMPEIRGYSKGGIEEIFGTARTSPTPAAAREQERYISLSDRLRELNPTAYWR